jgi:hypothetical protein
VVGSGEWAPPGHEQLIGTLPTSDPLKAVVYLFNAGRHGSFASREYGRAYDFWTIFYLGIDDPAPQAGLVLFHAVVNVTVLHFEARFCLVGILRIEHVPVIAES